MKTWYRWPTRCFALISVLGFLIAAAWASSVASEDERFIPPLALGGAMILAWRFGFSPSVRQTPTEVLIEQPWCTWHVPLSCVEEVGVAGGALSITAAKREIVAFGLSSSLLLSIFGDRLLSRAVDELQEAVAAAPGRRRSDRVRATGWRLLAEAVGIPVVYSAVAGLVRLW